MLGLLGLQSLIMFMYPQPNMQPVYVAQVPIYVVFSAM